MLSGLPPPEKLNIDALFRNFKNYSRGNIILFLAGKDKRMGDAQYQPRPSLIREDGIHRQYRRPAFTLAEVLITLGIIGVVAAMTIPTVMTNYKKSQIEARLKKLYTVMNQAVTLSIAHDTWTEPSAQAITPDGGDKTELNKWMQSALIPYLNGAEFPAHFDYPLANYNDETSYTKLTMSDGTICFFNPWKQIHVTCDINGIKGPNKQGVDLFYFFLDYKTSRQGGMRMGYFYPAGFTMYDNEDGDYTEGYIYGDRDKMIKGCKQDESNENYSINSCALLIMFDGWQIKDDYPVRL